MQSAEAFFVKINYREYINSAEWAKVRVDIVAVRGNKCEICGKRGSQVHHLTYDNLGCEEPEDLILTCGKCHMKEHGLIKVKKRKSKKGKKIKKKMVSYTTVSFTPNKKSASIEFLRAKAREMDFKQA